MVISFEHPSVPPLQKIYIYFWTAFGLCLSFLIILKMILKEMKVISRDPAKPRQNDSFSWTALRGSAFEHMTPAMIFLGTSVLIYQISEEYRTLLSHTTCIHRSSMAYIMSHWILFMIHIFFMVRTVAVCLECPDMLAFISYLNAELGLTMINVALFLQDCTALDFHQHMFFGQYLLLLNVYCPEVKELVYKIMSLSQHPFLENCVKYVPRCFLMILALSSMARDILICWLIGTIGDVYGSYGYAW